MEKLKNYTSEIATAHLEDKQIITSLVVSVSTRKIPFAGTDAQVFLNCGLFGNFILKPIGKDDFEMGAINTYSFETNFTLGDLRKAIVELGHDNTGKNPGWCVSGFRIQLKLQDSDILYLYKLWSGIGWLAKNKAPYYSTVVELQEVD